MEEKIKLLLDIFTETSQNSRDTARMWLDQHPSSLDDIVDVAFSNEQPHAWHAAWILDAYTDKNKEAFRYYLNSAIEKLVGFGSDGQRRIFLRIILKYEIPEQYEVLLYDYGKTLMLSNGESIGVKANGMKVLKKICDKYPELGDEIRHIIAELLPLNAKPAFVTSARKLFGVKAVKR